MPDPGKLQSAAHPPPFAGERTGPEGPAQPASQHEPGDATRDGGSRSWDPGDHPGRRRTGRGHRRGRDRYGRRKKRSFLRWVPVIVAVLLLIAAFVIAPSLPPPPPRPLAEGGDSDPGRSSSTAREPTRPANEVRSEARPPSAEPEVRSEARPPNAEPAAQDRRATVPASAVPAPANRAQEPAKAGERRGAGGAAAHPKRRRSAAPTRPSSKPRGEASSDLDVRWNR